MLIYKYGDEVKVITGFYLNLQGAVINYVIRGRDNYYEVSLTDPSAQFPNVGYVNVFIKEDDLELVKSR